MTLHRIPCPRCGALIVEGARKCHACKQWVGDRRPSQPSLSGPPSTARDPRFPRSFIIVASAVAAVMAVIVTGRKSPVGEAPPLTALTAAGSSTPTAPSPAGIGPEETDTLPPTPDHDAVRRWRVHDFRVGDVHPLDVAFNSNGKSVYVSADDASLREYKLRSGEMIHKASMPAQGDHIRLLFGRYVAILRHQDAARIPVMDTTMWDRDPILLEVGRSPGDIVELPDGHTVVAATTDSKRVTRFELPSGARLADITLPHASGHLYLIKTEDRTQVAALGKLTHAGRPGGAWIDLFDPDENPFGATRRSIAVGREPSSGAVTTDGSALLLPDRVSNTATLLRLSGITKTTKTAVGSSPMAAFLMHGDRYGVTLNAEAKTASVIDLSSMTVTSTLPLNGVPRTGVTSPDRTTLFVALGGTDWPPKGSGVVVISGDPPQVVASLPTGRGACAVTVSKDGLRAAVASYYDRSITLLEQ